MGQWEPLAERIPVDVRRLAVQLRRMKDRGGLTVPALAARTAQSAESWEKYLNGRQLPPLDAVEVLAQASGADYDRVGALWKLAEKAATGTGDRGRGKPVPHPDPLDPLGPEEGLPGNRRRRALLFGTAGVLAIGAAVTVLLAAGPSTGRAPVPEAAPTVTDRATAPRPPVRREHPVPRPPTARAPAARRAAALPAPYRPIPGPLRRPPPEEPFLLRIRPPVRRPRPRPPPAAAACASACSSSTSAWAARAETRGPKSARTRGAPRKPADAGPARHGNVTRRPSR
ncbi:helix-turn-helix domain-containing protein [Streptomyces sp. NPDC088197]|uniref:helix-turn-helix domain-containing protein n=1 Tax=Streptomyces sp. NPDC088197 TaxID=3365840 RepID=UPI0037FDDD59